MSVRAHRRAAATCVLAALVALSAPAAPRAADRVATPDTVAAVPLPARPRTGGPIYLDLRIVGYTPPTRGAADAVLMLADGTREIEIGRVTVFPNRAFTSKDGEPGRSYRFNVAATLAALAADRPIELRIRLVPIDPKVPIDGARMTIGGAEFRAGP